MRVGNYVKAAACSKVIVSWLAAYAFIGAYLNFTGIDMKSILLLFAVYMLVCFSYLFFKRKKLEIQRVSYVMHPLFFAAPVMGILLSVFENDGSNLIFQCVYLVFVIAGSMVNYYLSAFSVNLAGESRNRASVLMKYSGYRNRSFAIWLAAFVLAALLVMLIPAGGIRLSGALFSGSSRNSSTERTYEEVPEEVQEEETAAPEGNAEGYLLIVLTFFTAALVITVIILGRKMLAGGNGNTKHISEPNADIEEEVTVIRRSRAAGKGEGEITGNSAARVRKYFAGTVRKYYPDQVDNAKTPSQLLACEAENPLPEQESGEKREKARALRDIYEKARYSDETVTKEDAGKAKELSAELIKKKDVKKKF